MILAPSSLSANQEKTHAASGEARTAARLEVDRTPCAGITQIRFEGLRRHAALSALCAPLSDVKLSRQRLAPAPASGQSPPSRPRRTGPIPGTLRLMLVDARGLRF